MNQAEPASSHPADKRISTIMDPSHPLCRDDVVWMLEYIKKKVADNDPALRDLAQPRLIQNFHFFAEAAMTIIHRRPYAELEAERMRYWLREAAYGLAPEKDLKG